MPIVVEPFKSTNPAIPIIKKRHESLKELTNTSKQRPSKNCDRITNFSFGTPTGKLINSDKQAYQSLFAVQIIRVYTAQIFLKERINSWKLSMLLAVHVLLHNKVCSIKTTLKHFQKWWGPKQQIINFITQRSLVRALKAVPMYFFLLQTKRDMKSWCIKIDDINLTKKFFLYNIIHIMFLLLKWIIFIFRGNKNVFVHMVDFFSDNFLK